MTFTEATADECCQASQNGDDKELLLACHKGEGTGEKDSNLAWNENLQICF